MRGSSFFSGGRKIERRKSRSRFLRVIAHLRHCNGCFIGLALGPVCVSACVIVHRFVRFLLRVSLFCFCNRCYRFFKTNILEKTDRRALTINVFINYVILFWIHIGFLHRLVTKERRVFQTPISDASAPQGTSRRNRVYFFDRSQPISRIFWSIICPSRLKSNRLIGCSQTEN